MTIDELQDVVDRNGFCVAYLGRGTHRSRPYSCTLQPMRDNPQWRRDEVSLRGTGSSYEEAIEDALAQLSRFLIERLDAPGSD